MKKNVIFSLCIFLLLFTISCQENEVKTSGPNIQDVYNQLPAEYQKIALIYEKAHEFGKEYGRLNQADITNKDSYEKAVKEATLKFYDLLDEESKNFLKQYEEKKAASILKYGETKRIASACWECAPPGGGIRFWGPDAVLRELELAEFLPAGSRYLIGDMGRRITLSESYDNMVSHFYTNVTTAHSVTNEFPPLVPGTWDFYYYWDLTTFQFHTLHTLANEDLTGIKPNWIRPTDPDANSARGGWWDNWGKCAFGTVGGAGLGALGGAASGSAVPIIGTVIGAVAGGIFGGLAGAAASC